MPVAGFWTQLEYHSASHTSDGILAHVENLQDEAALDSALLLWTVHILAIQTGNYENWMSF